MIHLVRHAHAGRRERGTDFDRPLSDLGQLHAKLIAERIAADRVDRILSSPYLRCLQTIEPLSHAIGVPVEPLAILSDGAAPEPIARLILSTDHLVMCTHGDVLGALAGHLAAAGAPVDPRFSFVKGSAMSLVMSGSRVIEAHYFPPPR